jgi:hypothetical protein
MAKANDILIGVILVTAMAASILPFITHTTSYYDYTVDSDYNETFVQLQDAFGEIEGETSGAIKPIEEKGTTTDETTSELTLSGGFSYLKSFFALPSIMRNIMDSTASKLGLPGWIFPLVMLLFSIMIVGAILSVVFRTDRVG